MFSLEKILQNQVSVIELDEVYDFSSDYYEKSEIKKLDNVHLTGKIFRDSYDIIKMEAKVEGEMVLLDAISLEEVPYSFSFEIDEDLEEIFTNLQNSIDIMEFLWQNIVLEIPLGYTIVTDFSKYCGNGWKLVGEEEDTEKRKNLPFADLLK